MVPLGTLSTRTDRVQTVNLRSKRKVSIQINFIGKYTTALSISLSHVALYKVVAKVLTKYKEVRLDGIQLPITQLLLNRF